MNREQRAHIIRSTNGSSRLDDVEHIIRASDLEEFGNHDRKRNDDRKPFKSLEGMPMQFNLNPNMQCLGMMGILPLAWLKIPMMIQSLKMLM